MRLRVLRTAHGVWVGWPGRAKFFGPERGASASAGAAHDEVRAPMTGKLVKVEVAVGQKVNAGDVVAIMEAMKMEYRLATPHAGTVDGVFCKVGELVELGKTLVSIEPA